MKKIFIGILMMSAVVFAANDGYAGASLNRGGTIKEYKRLVKEADKAIKEDNWFLRERTLDEIENFIMTIDAYESTSSSGAKKNTRKFKTALRKKIVQLKKVDGMGGASINPKDMMPRYTYVSSLLDDAIKTGRNKKKAIEEAQDILDFIEKWESQQSANAKGYFKKYQTALRKKIIQLKK